MKMNDLTKCRWTSMCALFLIFNPELAISAINTGSTGADGALRPQTNIVIDMGDHPDGIYHYTDVEIPAWVTVKFSPNAKNSPIVWLVKGKCQIEGTIDVSAYTIWPGNALGTRGGPGGFYGGNSGQLPSNGQGPGGGRAGIVGGNASFGEAASGVGMENNGTIYGNSFLLPLIGGSGGAGSTQITQGSFAGGGGGGAILIAAPGQIDLKGKILALGAYGAMGNFQAQYVIGGAGSGGAVRLIAQTLSGNGTISAIGGLAIAQSADAQTTVTTGHGGLGRVRFDVLENRFDGRVEGVLTSGFQPIILPIAGEGVQLKIESVAGIALPANATGILANPDVIIPSQQANPIAIKVRGSNIPLNTEIVVEVKPVNGETVRGVGLNSQGTEASSIATVSLSMPRGGGIMYAKAVTGIKAAAVDGKEGNRSYVESGLTTNGEIFTKMEITATLGGKQRIVYFTDSGTSFSHGQ